MAYQRRAGDVIALDNPKAGALTMSTNLANFQRASTDPVRMFARRDAFRTVAEAKASAIASVPFDLYRRDTGNGRQKLNEEDHPLAAALENPQPHLTQYRWIEALQLDFELWDRWAFLIEVMDDGGYQFHRLPAKWVSFAIDGSRRITDVVVWAGTGRELSIPANFCAFDVGYDPDPSGNTTSGYSVSHTLEAASSELEFGADFRRALLNGGPKVPMYVTRPAGAPDWIRNGGRERFVSTFKSYAAEKAGEVPILEDGMTLSAAPQLDVNSIEYRETRLAAQIEFAIAMHFPPELVGYRQGNFSNIEALREQLYVDTLGGRFAAFRQALNASFRAAGIMDAGLYVEENVAVRLASSPEKQASLFQTQVGAPIRTVNEARRLLNQPPVAGGDELIVPLNVTKGGLASPTDTGAKSLLIRVAEIAGPYFKAASAADRQTAVDAQRKRFAGDLSKAFEQQGERVQKVLGDDSSPGPLELAFDLESENEKLAAVILPHSYALAVTGAAAVLAKYNPESAGFDPEVMLPWLSKAAGSYANGINVATIGKLTEAMFSGDGWTKAVEDLFDRMSTGQAEVWSQSIATPSTSFGASDAARASGLTQKTWRAAGSKDPRPEHAAIDGETVGAGDLFSNGLRWPGDPVGAPEDLANCHCRVEWSKVDE